jgi:hypothetical protein
MQWMSLKKRDMVSIHLILEIMTMKVKDIVKPVQDIFNEAELPPKDKKVKLRLKLKHLLYLINDYEQHDGIHKDDSVKMETLKDFISGLVQENKHLELKN